MYTNQSNHCEFVLHAFLVLYLIRNVQFYLQFRSHDVACAAEKKKKNAVEAAVLNVSATKPQVKFHHVNQAA